MANTGGDLEKFFHEADADGSAHLTLTELAVTLLKYGYSGTEQEIKEFFRCADTSGDDLVTLDEYLVAMEAAPPHVHLSAQMRRLFSLMDRNGDGEITRGELRAALAEMGAPLPEDAVTRILAALDKDDSDTINAEEFVTEFVRFLAA